jgi:hypothetical protein
VVSGWREKASTWTHDRAVENELTASAGDRFSKPARMQRLRGKYHARVMREVTSVGGQERNEVGSVTTVVDTSGHLALHSDNSTVDTSGRVLGDGQRGDGRGGTLNVCVNLPVPILQNT